jgi:predicted esterase
VRPVAVIAVGGDVPPELGSEALGQLSRVLLCRGETDPWYTAEKFAADAGRLTTAGVDVRLIEYPAGHEWSAEIVEAAAIFIDECRA